MTTEHDSKFVSAWEQLQNAPYTNDWQGLEVKLSEFVRNKPKNLLDKGKEMRVIQVIYADIFSFRGLAYRMLNKYQEAMTDFIHARALAQIVNDPERELKSVYGMIDVYRTGDRDPNFGKQLAPAQELKKQAKFLIGTHKIPYPNYTCAESLRHLGLLAHEEQDYDTALQEFEKALTEGNQLIEQNPNDKNAQALIMRTHSVKAVTLKAVGRTNEAIDLQQEAYRKAIKMHDVHWMGNAAIDLARSYRDLQIDPLTIDWAQITLQAALDKNGNIIDPIIYSLVQEEFPQVLSDQTSP